ncbi:MAG: acyltransferase, partial [Pyrinomonadaceae bacterium]|nr:acyltransferase [Pyrinomonadaceae bacterium]
MEKKKVYFPNLDGWRFAAFLGVFYHHSFQTQNTVILDDPIYRALKSTTTNGELGVDFFFVLSGFLIIYLLITEKHVTGKIDLRNFYIRRVLRIFPLYYLCVFFGFVVFPLLKSFFGAVPDESASPFLYSVFLGNLDIVRNAAMPDSGVLGILWSVAIEEQFYLVVPLVLLVVPTKYYPSVFVLVIVFSLVMRGLNIDSYYYIKFHTFSSIGNMAVGGLAAYYSATRPGFIRFVTELRPVFILALYVFTIGLLVFRPDIFAVAAVKVFESIIFSLAFGMIILEQNNSKRSLFK